ncbi:MAG: ABC transporter ATP-binding protein/permease [Lachnospiraceae bacterium]|nr:ABC transporter ATP-binding protein/permease [Lachnospiraceae bacterium]
MTKIFKYWKDHIGLVIIIIGLLVVQAYCDLKLPSYTADIVDVGITNSGIEHAAPEKMSRDTFENICLFLTEDEIETVSKYYDLTDDGNYKLNTEKDKELDRIDEIIGMPIVMISQMSVPQAEGEEAPIVQIKAAYGAGMMKKEELLGMKTQAEEKMGEYSETIITSQAVSFLKTEYKKIGVNVSNIQRHYLVEKGLMMLLVSVIAMAVSIIAGLLASIVAGKVGKELRDGVFKKVVSFSNAEMDKFSTASLITRSTNDIQQVQQVTVMLLRMVMYAPILAVGGIIKVLQTDTGLDWIIVLAVVLIICVVLLLVAIAMPKFKKMQTLLDKLNLVAREILTGVLVIRAFGREKKEEERFEDANLDLTKTQLFTNRVMTFMMPTMMFIMNAITVLIVWMSAKGIDTGRLQVGDMMAFITYAMQIIMSFLILTMVSIMLPRASVAAGRIDEVIHTEATIIDCENSKETDKLLTHIKGIVKFEDVSFRYPGADDNAIENISFTAEPGKTTAIIGSTGCGKSTLIHLIPRFYDVTEGKITIDDVDIREISQHKLRDVLGFVPQKGVLFSGDIESNIKFAGEKVTDEDMILGAEIAQATEFIESKPDKYSSEIAQGGTNVSGGQKQRLSIARAIAKKPQVFLFDDSFSALDYKTDVVLRKALKERLSDSTIIIVAQRISTILHADQIIVLDDGKVAGKGTHEELLQTCEAYKEIAKSQLSEKELKGGIA